MVQFTVAGIFELRSCFPEGNGIMYTKETTSQLKETSHSIVLNSSFGTNAMSFKEAAP